MSKNNGPDIIAKIVEKEEIGAIQALNDANYDIEAVLEKAARDGNTKLIEIFNKAGWDLSSNGDTLLHIASITPNNAKMVNFLAEKLTPVPYKH